MTKTALVSSPIYYRHNPGKGHPESARRLRAIINEVQKSRVLDSQRMQLVQPRKARVEDVELVHKLEYIRLVEAVCRSGGGLLDLQDTSTSPESFETALYAVGGTLRAVDLVMKGQFENAFAMVRPPGHHAGRFRACGFCIFNNVAIAAEHLIRNWKLRRVVIFDVDAHHGNGTQEVFYGTDSTLYISLHEDPTSFPGTGFLDEIGEKAGKGYNVNIPLPFGTGDKVYLDAIREIVVPIVHQFGPEFMLVSAGFDAHYTDPVANLSLSACCMQQVHELIAHSAVDECHGRLVSVLEGGYSLEYVGKLALSALASLSDVSYAAKDRAPPTSLAVKRQGEKIIREVKRIQKAFWQMA